MPDIINAILAYLDNFSTELASVLEDQAGNLEHFGQESWGRHAQAFQYMDTFARWVWGVVSNLWRGWLLPLFTWTANGFSVVATYLDATVAPFLAAQLELLDHVTTHQNRAGWTHVQHTEHLINTLLSAPAAVAAGAGGLDDALFKLHTDTRAALGVMVDKMNELVVWTDAIVGQNGHLQPDPLLWSLDDHADQVLGVLFGAGVDPSVSPALAAYLSSLPKRTPAQVVADFRIEDPRLTAPLADAVQALITPLQ